MANEATALGPWQPRSFEPLQSVTALSSGMGHRKRNAQVLIYDLEGQTVTRLAWTLHIMKCWPSCTSVAQHLPQLNCFYGGAGVLHSTMDSRYGLLFPVEQASPDLPAICPAGHLFRRSTAVTFNLHFPYFPSPDSSDSVLGSSLYWPAELALLLLDSFMPSLREAIIEKSCKHTHGSGY